MDCKDLIVGDWANIKGKPVKLTLNDLRRMLILFEEVDFHIEPIPLTEDILVKNGFEKTTNDWNRHRPLIIFESIGFPTISIHADMDMKHFWAHGNIDLTYVHTLQHLLRLCGVEKELTI